MYTNLDYKKIVSVSKILTIALDFAKIDSYKDSIKAARDQVSNMRTTKLLLLPVIEMADSTKKLQQSEYENMHHPYVELTSAMIFAHHAMNEIRDAEDLCDGIDASENPSRIATRIHLCKTRVVDSLRQAIMLVEITIKKDEGNTRQQ